MLTITPATAITTAYCDQCGQRAVQDAAYYFQFCTACLDSVS